MVASRVVMFFMYLINLVFRMGFLRGHGINASALQGSLCVRGHGERSLLRDIDGVNGDSLEVFAYENQKRKQSCRAKPN